jgi:hypothetical protein
MAAGTDVPDQRPIRRFVSAAAEAAASILHSIQVADLARDVFAEPRHRPRDNANLGKRGIAFGAKRSR